MTIRFGILTLSDRSARGERSDASGPALADLVRAQNWSVAKQALLPDNESAMRAERSDRVKIPNLILIKILCQK